MRSGSIQQKRIGIFICDEDPHRTVQNKNAIDILMFLGAIEKTKTDDEGNIIFNGNRHLAFC
jgi:hypothetical protein